MDPIKHAFGFDRSDLKKQPFDNAIRPWGDPYKNRDDYKLSPGEFPGLVFFISGSRPEANKRNYLQPDYRYRPEALARTYSKGEKQKQGVSSRG